MYVYFYLMHNEGEYGISNSHFGILNGIMKKKNFGRAAKKTYQVACYIFEQWQIMPTCLFHRHNFTITSTNSKTKKTIVTSLPFWVIGSLEFPNRQSTCFDGWWNAWLSSLVVFVVFVVVIFVFVVRVVVIIVCCCCHQYWIWQNLIATRTTTVLYSNIPNG